MSTSLGRMRILASTAGVRVSPLELGGGNIGESWSKLFGYMDKGSAFALLDAFVEVPPSIHYSACREKPRGSNLCRLGVISSTRPTVTRAKSRRRGSANGWQREGTETNSSLPPNSPRITRRMDFVAQ